MTSPPNRFFFVPVARFERKIMIPVPPEPCQEGHQESGLYGTYIGSYVGNEFVKKTHTYSPSVPPPPAPFVVATASVGRHCCCRRRLSPRLLPPKPPYHRTMPLPLLAATVIVVFFTAAAAIAVAFAAIAVTL
jgi:hypothetical protein